MNRRVVVVAIALELGPAVLVIVSLLTVGDAIGVVVGVTLVDLLVAVVVEAVAELFRVGVDIGISVVAVVVHVEAVLVEIIVEGGAVAVVVHAVVGDLGGAGVDVEVVVVTVLIAGRGAIPVPAIGILLADDVAVLVEIHFIIPEDSVAVVVLTVAELGGACVHGIITVITVAVALHLAIAVGVNFICFGRTVAVVVHAVAAFAVAGEVVGVCIVAVVAVVRSVTVTVYFNRSVAVAVHSIAGIGSAGVSGSRPVVTVVVRGGSHPVRTAGGVAIAVRVEAVVDIAVAVIVHGVTRLRVAGELTAVCVVAVVVGSAGDPVGPTGSHPVGVSVEAVVDRTVAVLIHAIARFRSAGVDGAVIIIAVVATIIGVVLTVTVTIRQGLSKLVDTRRATRVAVEGDPPVGGGHRGRGEVELSAAAVRHSEGLRAPGSEAPRTRGIVRQGQVHRARATARDIGGDLHRLKLSASVVVELDVSSRVAGSRVRAHVTIRRVVRVGVESRRRDIVRRVHWGEGAGGGGQGRNRQAEESNHEGRHQTQKGITHLRNLSSGAWEPEPNY